MLEKINADDLLFTDEIEDDRTNTYLTLNDYDWMQYLLKTRFRTEKLGILKVEFEYFGMTTSTMKVVQILEKDVNEYVYEYSTAVFAKYMKEFLTAHMNAWDSTYAFNGEDFVIAFFNEVLEVGILQGDNNENE